MSTQPAKLFRNQSPRVVLAVDGKTVRGARAADGSAPHLLACLDRALRDPARDPARAFRLLTGRK